MSIQAEIQDWAELLEQSSNTGARLLIPDEALRKMRRHPLFRNLKSPALNIPPVKGMDQWDRFLGK